MESRTLETHLGSLIPTNVTPRTPHWRTRAQRKLLKLYGLALHSSASEAGGGQVWVSRNDPKRAESVQVYVRMRGAC